MGKKKVSAKSSDETPSSKVVTSESMKNNVSEKEVRTSATTDKEVNAKKNLGNWGISGLKPFALGVIVALLGSVAFSAYHNVSSNQVRDFFHKNLDGLVGRDKVDQVLNLFFSETTATETRTKDDDSRRTDHVTGVDSRTSKSSDSDSNKRDSTTGDRLDGKHVTDDRKGGDSSHQPSPKVVKEETTQRAKDEDDLKKKTKSPKPRYPKADITNKVDNRIRKELDQADEALETGKITEAISQYDAIIGRYPHSPRAFYGKANALNKMADQKKSNAVLEESIAEFLNVLSLPDVPKSLAIKAAKTCAERQSFRGH